MNNGKIILASGSPRRKDLLEQAGIDFEVIQSRIDESVFELTDPDEYVIKLSNAKAFDVAENYEKSWVIGADTIVVIDGEILGKPESNDHAAMMLKKLSNNIHRVFTGFSLCCLSKNCIISKSVTTEVKFRRLSEREICWYISTDEPFGKAGAYAVQGAGMCFVESITGSYTNVVGLPMCELVEILIDKGVVLR